MPSASAVVRAAVQVVPETVAVTVWPPAVTLTVAVESSTVPVSVGRLVLATSDETVTTGAVASYVTDTAAEATFAYRHRVMWVYFNVPEIRYYEYRSSASPIEAR
ncbi:hypothetical protein ETAA1_06220 [Urbifossiella limnaea]|uniref:Uncharacterized protein n=1 Tax=Urbifossiella limnaea TaxID=2528023 RepID=A0A517XMK8_9BACT|nr:hypothetical protein ETAA1_06220 [Urbifossiella limnaea]